MAMHVETLGRGRDIILLHGWGLHGGVWRELAARLAASPIGSRRGPRARDGAVAASFRVVVPDLPGHGRSRAANGDFTLEDVVAELQGYVTAPAVWVGWSLGALAALTAAQRLPQRVSRLVLIGATPRFAQAPDWPCAMPPQTLAQFARDLEGDYHGTLLRFLSLQSGAAGAAGRDALRALRALLAQHGEPDPAGLRAGLRLLAQTDLRAALPDIRAPALVLHGAHDRLAPPAAAEFLAAHLPVARLTLIPSAGHAPFLSHPDASWRALEEFLHA